MKPTVLFVDDEPMLLESITTMLRKKPYRLLTASSGEEALELLARESVDVVVSDERMPSMQGSELLTVVRARHPGIVRVLLTGQASVPAAIRAVNEAKVLLFLEKPIAKLALEEALTKAFEARWPADAAADPADRDARAELEALHPGITSVRRDASGAIVLDEDLVAGLDP